MKTNKPFQLFFLFLCFSILKVTIVSQTQPIDDRSELKPNNTITREITGKAAHLYKFDLKKDEFFQVKAEQKGIDIMLKLLDANGKALAEMDSPNGKAGFETLSFIASNGGNFILEIVSPDEKAEKGSYILKRESSRTATAQDKRRVEIEKIFVEGIKARDSGQKDIAVSKLNETLIGWAEVKDQYLKDLTSQQLYNLQAPTDILTLINDIEGEVNKAINILFEGMKISFKSSEEAIPAREKLNQALTMAQKQYEKIKDENLRNKIKKSNETAKESLIILKRYEFRAKYVEFTAFQYIAQTHGNLNQRHEELEYLRRSLTSLEEILANKSFLEIPSSFDFDINIFLIRLRSNQAAIIGDIGKNLNNYFGKSEEPIGLLKQSAELLNRLWLETGKIGYRWHEAQQLSFIAGIYGRDSKNSAVTIEYYNKSIDILRSMPDNLPGVLSRRDPDIASKLISLGVQYVFQFNFKKAFEIYNESLNLCRKIDDKRGQIAALNQISFLHFHLNNKIEVAKYANQVLEILQSPDYKNNWKTYTQGEEINEQFGMYQELFDALFEHTKNDYTAVAYRLMENYEKSLEFYKKALDTAPPLRSANTTKFSLRDVAFTYAMLKKWDDAAEFYKKRLEKSREIDGKEDIAISLADVGWTLAEGKKFEEALKYQKEALTIYQTEGYGEGQNFSGAFGNVLSDVSQTYYGLGNKDLAIFYGKRAVNAMQSERRKLQNLDLAAQKGFLERKEKHYRRLAEWLIESGRLIEAERVLEMLKDEEIGDYLRRDTAFVQKTALQIEYNSEEKKAIEDYRSKSETLSSIGAEFSKLEDLKRKNVKLTAEQDRQFAELNAKLTKANQEFQDFLTQLSEEFKKGKDVRGESGDNKVISGRLKKWTGVVYIYTLVGEQQFSSFLYTLNATPRSEQKITSAELNKKIFAFREAVKNPNIDPKPLGKELYDILIKPYESELDAAKAKTILWSLDGNLRILPLAALWDGKQYFGQKYQNIVITSESHFNLDHIPSTDLNALGLGVSESKTVTDSLTERKFVFSALPAVPSELASIVKTKNSPKGILSGTSLLDTGFTRKSFAEQLLKGYKVIHIASHFSMNAGDASRSFLLLGDGTTLTVNELNTEAQFSSKFEDVELLVLSACETAVGETDSNAKEVEGFAYVAQQNGAKAILATLWSVADNSTQLLMTEFYRLRKANPNLTKAEAMQLAQKAMIEGTLKSDRAGNLKGIELAGGKQSQQSDFNKDPKAPFAHPYYWSPFVLIGNWK